LPTAWTDAVGKAAVPFANRILPTAVASLLAKVTAAELAASPLCQRYTWLLAKLPAFLLAKSSFPSLKTPTVLSQQELGNPVGKAFTNRVGGAVGEARVSCSVDINHSVAIIPQFDVRKINYHMAKYKILTRMVYIFGCRGRI
jgi:hypothetical protein